MTRKQRRLYFVVLGVLAVGAAAALVLTALREDVAFFFSPSEIVEAKAGLVDKLVAAFTSETPDTALAKLKLA